MSSKEQAFAFGLIETFGLTVAWNDEGEQWTVTTPGDWVYTTDGTLADTVFGAVRHALALPILEQSSFVPEAE